MISNTCNVHNVPEPLIVHAVTPIWLKMRQLMLANLGDDLFLFEIHHKLNKQQG